MLAHRCRCRVQFECRHLLIPQALVSMAARYQAPPAWHPSLRTTIGSCLGQVSLRSEWWRPAVVRARARSDEREPHSPSELSNKHISGQPFARTPLNLISNLDAWFVSRERYPHSTSIHRTTAMGKGLLRPRSDTYPDR